MKNKLLLKIKNLKVNLFILFFSLFLFGFGQSDSRFCGNVENFEFSNGHETVHITDDETYIFDDLPGHFYVKVDVNGYVQSVKYNVTNLDTNEQFEVIENLIPYTFPAGDADWNIGLGTFEVIASIYAQNNAYGYVCDTESVTFTLTDNVACTADAGTLTAVYSSVALSNGEAQLSATPNGDVHVPADFSKIFVLTSGSDLVIEQVNATPNFTVTEAGNYTIHTLVYPSDLDLSIVELGVTTGFDVNSLLIQGGGDLCASLDVAGAPIHVGEEPCTAYAGTLTVVESTVCSTGEVTISATSNGDANEPAGFSTLFVLTSGDDLVIEQVGGSPEFTVVGGGDYTIHTLVYPETLDLSIVELGVTTGFDVNSLLIQGGGDLCGSLDVAGAPVQIINPDAGTLTAVDSSVELSNGEAQLSATTNGDVNVPSGYSSIFVLTSGDDLVIEQVGGSPEFTVTEAGNYTIHTLVYPSDLDLSIVELGVTTGFDVNSLLIQGGGDLCASLDVAGAPIHVGEEPCTADAGTLHATADSVNLLNGSATLTATPGGELVQPAGFAVLYVLTSGDDLVIEQVGGSPEFTVTEAGDYTIHTLVYPETLDLSIIELGVTTGFDVNSLLIQGGGDLCGSLDVAGAPIHVGEEPCTADAGTLTAVDSNVELLNGEAQLSATPNGDINIPAGFSNIFVLTSGDDLVIEQVNSTPNFTVTEAGDYTIHTLVFPSDLDLSIVELGVTTGFDVNSLLIQGGGDLCASLDVAGAPIHVNAAEDTCTANAGTLYSYHPIQCLDYGVATIYADEVEAPVIPEGYNQLFVLTNAFNLTILDVSTTAEFTVNHAGFYRIHSLVYDPATLDLSIVQFGYTTAFDVVHLLQQGGGDICASLDVRGALNLVLPSWFCNLYGSYAEAGRNPQGDLVNDWLNQYDDYQNFEDAMLAEFTETSVYPNPVKTTLNINTLLLQDEIVNYTILDMQGRLLKRGVINTISSDRHQIEMSNISSGTYIVQLSSEFRNFTTKIQVN